MIIVLIYQQIKKCNYFLILYICQASLTPPLFIEVPVPSLESERSCICVLPLRFSFWILEMFRLSIIFLAFHFIQILLVLFLLLNDLKLEIYSSLNSVIIIKTKVFLPEA